MEQRAISGEMKKSDRDWDDVMSRIEKMTTQSIDDPVDKDIEILVSSFEEKQKKTKSLSQSNVAVDKAEDVEKILKKLRLEHEAIEEQLDISKNAHDSWKRKGVDVKSIEETIEKLNIDQIKLSAEIENYETILTMITSETQHIQDKYNTKMWKRFTWFDEPVTDLENEDFTESTIDQSNEIEWARINTAEEFENGEKEAPPTL
jgi:hypothetical protein